MKRVRIKTWLESRLNRKIFFSFLTVSLIPLCIVYCYINSAYSEKLRSDAFTQNQLTERNKMCIRDSCRLRSTLIFSTTPWI